MLEYLNQNFLFDLFNQNTLQLAQYLLQIQNEYLNTVALFKSMLITYYNNLTNTTTTTTSTSTTSTTTTTTSTVNTNPLFSIVQ